MAFWCHILVHGRPSCNKAAADGTHRDGEPSAVHQRPLTAKTKVSVICVDWGLGSSPLTDVLKGGEAGWGIA